MHPSGLLPRGVAANCCRLIDASDLSTLPVVHHSRLFRAPVTHVAFSSCAAYLAVAAGSTQRLALLKVAATGQQVQLLGYVKAAGDAWCENITGRSHRIYQAFCGYLGMRRQHVHVDRDLHCGIVFAMCRDHNEHVLAAKRHWLSTAAPHGCLVQWQRHALDTTIAASRAQCLRGSLQ